jgi:hypothetical protein
MEVMRLENEFDAAHRASMKGRRRSDVNWGIYSGFDYGQWPDEAVSNLQRQNRHVVQYNFVRGKVDRLAGSISRSDVDVDFVPVETEYNSLTRQVKEVFYADKELMDWDTENIQTLVDGLIYQGVEELIISDKYSALGNIGFERIMPGHIILDPNWKSHRSYDLRKAWKVAYLTPIEMKAKYPRVSDKVDQMALMEAMQETDYQNDESSKTLDNFGLEEVYGTKYRVIEHHYIEETPINIDIATVNGKQVEVPEYMPEEEKMAFYKEYGIKANDIIKYRKVKRIHKVKTTCRQLSPLLVLEERDSRIQIGRLPFFPWSAANINGRPSGIVDLLIDAQQTLNKRESLADHMIASSAHGAQLIDPAILNGDKAKTLKLMEDITKPNARIMTAPGALASGRNFIKQIEKTAYSGEIYQDIQRMVDNIDKISGQTATLDGESTYRDTGILFARKQMQSEIALTVLTNSVRQHWNDKGEAYLELAKDLYSGVYREFRADFGNTAEDNLVQLNTVDYDEEGNRIMNDIGALPRHKVIVTESPAGITVRTTERAVNAEVLNALPQEAMLSRAQATKNIMKTLDMSDEDRKRMEAASDVEFELTLARMNAELQALEGQAQQQQAMAVQAEQQVDAGDMEMAMAQAQAVEGQQAEQQQ